MPKGDTSRWNLVGRFADLTAISQFLVGIIVLFGGGSVIYGIVAALEHDSIPAWLVITLVLPVAALAILARRDRAADAGATSDAAPPARPSRDLAPGEASASMVDTAATLRRTIERATLEAALAKSFVNHTSSFITQVHEAMACVDVVEAADRLRHLRPAIFGAASEGLHRQPGETMRCAFFTLLETAEGIFLCARADHHFGHTRVVEDNPLKLDESFAGYAYRTRKAVYAPEARRDSQFQLLHVEELDDIGSIICAPGWGADVGPEPAGVLSVSSNQVGAFDATDIRFVAICAEAFAFVESLLRGLNHEEPPKR
jgi:GAF domain-containing protein